MTKNQKTRRGDPDMTNEPKTLADVYAKADGGGALHIDGSFTCEHCGKHSLDVNTFHPDEHSFCSWRCMVLYFVADGVEDEVEQYPDCCQKNDNCSAGADHEGDCYLE